jgi:hypothetical protein
MQLLPPPIVMVMMPWQRLIGQKQGKQKDSGDSGKGDSFIYINFKYK